MAAITEFVYPFLLFIKDKMKMASIKKVSDEKKPFKDNETNNDNKNFELNEIDKNIWFNYIKNYYALKIFYFNLFFKTNFFKSHFVFKI